MPLKAASSSHKPISAQILNRLSLRVQSEVIGHRDGVVVKIPLFFQEVETSTVLLLQYVICVQPKDIVLRCLSKRIVACNGKIIDSGKIVNRGTKGSGNILGVIGGACIHDDHLIHQIPYARQT